MVDPAGHQLPWRPRCLETFFWEENKFLSTRNPNKIILSIVANSLTQQKTCLYMFVPTDFRSSRVEEFATKWKSLQLKKWLGFKNKPGSLFLTKIAADSFCSSIFDLEGTAICVFRSINVIELFQQVVSSKFFGSLSCKAFKSWTQILHFKLVNKNMSSSWGHLYLYTLQGTNISHLAKRRIVFKSAVVGDKLVPRRVYIYTCTFCVQQYSWYPPQKHFR